MGCFRKIKDVLKYLGQVPDMDKVLEREGTKIKLRFAADGRCTTKKVGTVMAVFSILAEGVMNASHQYTLCLYNGMFSRIMIEEVFIHCSCSLRLKIPF